MELFSLFEEKTLRVFRHLIVDTTLVVDDIYTRHPDVVYCLGDLVAMPLTRMKWLNGSAQKEFPLLQEIMIRGWVRTVMIAVVLI